MKTLKEIFENHSHYGSDIGCADKGSTHSYIETYERILSPFRNKCKIMEIGIALGHSIRMWDEYFENSEITGVDISIIFDLVKTKNKVDLIQADATKKEFRNKIKDQKFDIIIDDGDHTQQSQIATFEMLKSSMNKGGVYIIEDILSPELALPDLLKIHDRIEVIDLRSIKGRFDDMLILYYF